MCVPFCAHGGFTVVSIQSHFDSKQQSTSFPSQEGGQRACGQREQGTGKCEEKNMGSFSVRKLLTIFKSFVLGSQHYKSFVIGETFTILLAVCVWAFFQFCRTQLIPLLKP